MPKNEFMTEKQQLNLIYKLFDFPPTPPVKETNKFVWQLLDVGCPPRYILRAYSALEENKNSGKDVNSPNE